MGRMLYMKICKLGEAFMYFLISAGHLNTPKCFNVSLYLPCFYFSRSSGYIYTSTQQKARESPALDSWLPPLPSFWVAFTLVNSSQAFSTQFTPGIPQKANMYKTSSDFSVSILHSLSVLPQPALKPYMTPHAL